MPAFTGTWLLLGALPAAAAGLLLLLNDADVEVFWAELVDARELDFVLLLVFFVLLDFLLLLEVLCELVDAAATTGTKVPDCCTVTVALDPVATLVPTGPVYGMKTSPLGRSSTVAGSSIGSALRFQEGSDLSYIVELVVTISGTCASALIHGEIVTLGKSANIIDRKRREASEMTYVGSASTDCT